MRQLLRCAALAAALLSACDLEPRVTSDVARDTWAAAQPRARDRISTLRDRQKVLAERVAALRVPDGTNDPALQQLVTELQTGVAVVEPPLAAAEAGLAQASADVDASLTKQNKVEARRTVEASVARLEPLIAEAAAPLDALEPRVAEAEAGMQRGMAAVEAEMQALRRIAIDGGKADLTDIEFKADAATLDTESGTSRSALTRVLGMATACDGLRFEIVGHTARGDADAQQALSLARAEAVKAYLIVQGVSADKIAATKGAGATRLAVDEPEPGSAAAQAMAPAELASRRNKNDRVEVVVTTSCAAAAAAVPPPVPGPPPGAAAADPARPAAGQPPPPPPPVRVEAVPAGQR